MDNNLDQTNEYSEFLNDVPIYDTPVNNEMVYNVPMNNVPMNNAPMNNAPMNNVPMNNGHMYNGATKFCKFCGATIPMNAVICNCCGRQVEQVNYQQPIIINNSMGIRPKSKWVALLLCCIGYLGLAGLHKFYEGKILLGIVYLFTLGIFGIGTIIDTICLLFKPNPYY